MKYPRATRHWQSSFKIVVTLSVTALLASDKLKAESLPTIIPKATAVLLVSTEAPQATPIADIAKPAHLSQPEKQDFSSLLNSSVQLASMTSAEAQEAPPIPKAQDPKVLDTEISQAEKAQEIADEEESKPDWYAKLTKIPPGDFTPLNPCRLEYRLSWQKILKSGEAILTYGAENHKDFPDMMIARSSGKSSGLARAFWKYDYKFFSAIDPQELRSKSFFSKEEDSEESLVTSNRFDKNGLLCEQRMVVFENGDVYDRRERFPYIEARDLLSTALYLRSLDWKEGDRIVELVHPFNGPYILEVTCQGKEMHSSQITEEGEVLCYKLDIGIAKIDDDLELKDYKKFKKATMWVSDDEYRLPIDIKAEVFIGSIHTTLVKRQQLSNNNIKEKEAEKAEDEETREFVSEVQKMEKENE